MEVDAGGAFLASGVAVAEENPHFQYNTQRARAFPTI